MREPPQSRAIAAAMAFVVIGMQVFIIQPGIVQGFVSRLGLSEARAGYLASAEMFGIAAATVLCAIFTARLNWRWVCAIALSILGIADLLSAFAHDYLHLIVTRSVAGVASGALISLGYAVAGTAINPNRSFGFLIMLVLTYGALGLLAIPIALDNGGVQGIMIALAVMALAGFIFLPAFPKSVPQSTLQDSTAASQAASQSHAAPIAYAPARSRSATLMLASLLCFFLGQGVIWAYLFLIGIHMGIGEQAVANALTISQFAGIAGAFAAAALAARVTSLALFVIGIALSIAPLFFFSLRLTGVSFGAAVVVFNWAANLLTPLLVAIVARIEPRWVQPGAALQMLGLAVGPAIAATLIGSRGFTPVLALCAALFALSLILGFRPSRVTNG